MSDVILIATIGAFFLLATLLVRALDRMIAGSGDAGPQDAAPEDSEPEQELEPGRQA